MSDTKLSEEWFGLMPSETGPSLAYEQWRRYVTEGISDLERERDMWKRIAIRHVSNKFIDRMSELLNDGMTPDEALSHILPTEEPDES